MPLAASLRYLRDYVAIPSVNPMRRSDIDPSIACERRYAEHLREQLRGLGLDAELIGDPERPSVIAEARASGARDTLLIASHLDTVPVDGMEIDPFDPKLDGGRLYGRGSCDTKGGMAAAVDALERVLGRGTLRRNVLLVGEADEELSSAGARAVLDHLGAHKPHWAIATEPTELRVVTAHKGIAHARLVARGVAGHASDPARGRNAIVALARAVTALDELGQRLADRVDPRLGPPTLSVGVIRGGSAANIIPDQASLLIDRRLVFGEDDRSAQAEIEAALAAAGVADDVRVDWTRLEKAALATPDDHACVRLCQRLQTEAGLPNDLATAAFGTDAGILAASGIPSVVLGPGSINQAHTAREWVETRQVEQMADLLVRLFESAD